MDICWHSNKSEQRCKALNDLFVDTSEHGKTNGNLEYSSKTIRKYSFLLFVGRGPLKSMLIVSNGRVALIRGTFSGGDGTAWKRILMAAKLQENGFIGNKCSTTFWMSYHKETSTSSWYWRITFLLQSFNTSRIALTMKQQWKYYKQFLWNLEMKSLPAISSWDTGLIPSSSENTQQGLQLPKCDCF